MFYRVESTDSKHYHRACRACEGKKEITVNGITFKCPVCYKEEEVLRVHGFFVRRYRVFSIENFIDNTDWKYEAKDYMTRYQLYHKSGKGRYTTGVEHKTIRISSQNFSAVYMNPSNPSENFVAHCLYSDYKLAVAVADRLTEEQIAKVRAYNEANNTDYELPVFKIEHDKKSN